MRTIISWNHNNMMCLRKYRGHTMGSNWHPWTPQPHTLLTEPGLLVQSHHMDSYFYMIGLVTFQALMHYKHLWTYPLWGFKTLMHQSTQEWREDQQKNSWKIFKSLLHHRRLYAHSACHWYAHLLDLKH